MRWSKHLSVQSRQVYRDPNTGRLLRGDNHRMAPLRYILTYRFNDVLLLHAVQQDFCLLPLSQRDGVGRVSGVGLGVWAKVDPHGRLHHRGKRCTIVEVAGIHQNVWKFLQESLAPCLLLAYLCTVRHCRYLSWKESGVMHNSHIRKVEHRRYPGTR